MSSGEYYINQSMISDESVFHYPTGSILNSRSEALICPINIVGVMGAGLARAFGQKWPHNTVEYIHAYQAGQLAMGKMFIVSPPDYDQKPIIINFPTKNHFRDPSKLEYIREGFIHQNNIYQFCA